MNLSVFDPSYVWKTRSTIIPLTTLTIPLVIEMIHLAKRVYVNPDCIKVKGLKTYKNITQLFIRQAHEKKITYHQRVVKNVSRLIVLSSFLGVSLLAVYLLVPPNLTISVALIAIQVIAKLYPMVEQLPKRVKNVKSYLKDSFQLRELESLEIFYTRRMQAVKTIVKCMLIFAAATSLAVLAGYTSFLLSQTTSVWQIGKNLPFQTPLGVFLEYAALGLAHLGLAIHALIKKRYEASLFYLVSAIAAVAFPISYILQGTEVRLHHSFLGLALQLIPLRPIQCLGTIITFDAFLNLYFGMQGIVRGKIIKHFGCVYVRQYDYQNALIAHFSYAMTALAVVCLFNQIANYFTKTEKIK